MVPSLLAPIAVVGGITVDLTATVPRLPRPGETVLGGALARTPGGRGANQAVAAARLGAPTRIIGCVGDDTDGRTMLEGLADAGVDVSGVWLGDEPTGTALITVDADGRTQVTVCPGANADVSLLGVSFADDEAVLAQLEIPLDVVSALAISVPGFLAVNAAPAVGLPDAVIARADLIVVNASQFDRQPELAGGRAVAITSGATGAVLRRGGVEVARIASPPARVVDATGSGDAFSAALTLALHAGWDDEAALSVACAVGADAAAHPSSRPRLRPLADYAAGLR